MWRPRCWALFVLFATLVCVLRAEISVKRSFSIDYENNCFVKDGSPFRYVSGSMHYFKVPTELWSDRLRKMRFGGLNAVQTYIQWSTIEPSPGVFDFTGNNNIARFFEEAQEAGLLVIVRVGPYIDAEVDMGGLPYWLLSQDGNPQLRSSDPIFLKPLDRYLNKLLPLMKPYLYANGGPIIMVQVENEFGSYPTCVDMKYKTHMRDTFRRLLGDEVVLFTTDGNTDSVMRCGQIPEVYSTVDFGSGSDVQKSFAVQRNFEPKGPAVNSEFYVGWLDHWEEGHHVTATQKAAKTLDEMLAANASVNIYMYHGGTHFGFIAGSNGGGNDFTPVPTSYDYDAPISEAGDLRDNFFALKNVISNYISVSIWPEYPNATHKMRLEPTPMTFRASIFDLLPPQAIVTKMPQTFEKLNHSSGFMLYSANLTFQPTDPAVLSISGLHDRAQVFVDKRFVGTLSRTEKITSLPILAEQNSTIDILVENEGRICYGQGINERKGIVSNVTIDGTPLIESWRHYRLFDDWNSVLDRVVRTIPKTESPPQAGRIPAFYHGTFTLPNATGYPFDSFLRADGWTKGVAFLNGHNLGRYWPVAGPQETLYAPSVYFRPYPHLNHIVLFELERSPCSGAMIEDNYHQRASSSSSSKCSIQFVDKHVINGPIPKH